MNNPSPWQGCVPDIDANRYAWSLRHYFQAVIQPAMEALDRDSNNLLEKRKSEPGLIFVWAENEGLKHVTGLTFCLALHSHFERQLRQYLGDCANVLQQVPMLSSVLSNRWADVEGAFKALRGIPPLAVPGYVNVAVVKLMADVCRHGAGRSLRKLHDAAPALWARGDSKPDHPPRITLGILDEICMALENFWLEIDCLYYDSFASSEDPAVREAVDLRRVQRTERSKRAEEIPFLFGKQTQH